ncbi:hypothetical protein F4806DRAFT_508377 [Annulohypoxylon nitens]|nr:hypothetical protein F4806DRAFT_508377 [Annulohypoxylon nitens]
MEVTNNSSPNEDEVVNITLILRPSPSPLSPLDAEPKREFTLSRQKPSIRIGRASKVPTKGFVGEKNNAWFESPVMSRQHAELLFDCDRTPKGVFIKDIGSLHGTFHTPVSGKESRLDQHSLVELSDGDSLRFGTDIFRASTTFPPCALEFFMDIRRTIPKAQIALSTILSTNRVFTIPDDMDEDDDDDDSVIETHIFPAQKDDTRRGLSIDLTQDDTDEADDHTARDNIASDVIDLTSEPDEHSDHELNNPSNRHSSAIPSIAIMAIPSFTPHEGASFRINGYSPALPTGTYHSPKPMGLDNVPDQFSDHEHGTDAYHDQDDEDMNSEDIRLTDSDISSVVTRDSLNESDAGGEETDEDEGDHVGSSSSSISYEYGWENDSLSSEHDDVYDERSNIWGDYESTDDIPYSDDDTSSSSEDSRDSVSNTSAPAVDSLDANSASGIPTKPADANQSFVTPFLFTAPAQQGTPAPHPREPSPSDAAMFKSHPVIDRIPSDTRAQALGEKSGKYEFFAARESNRTTLVDQLPPPPISALRETLSEEITNRLDPKKGMEADQVSHCSVSQVVADSSQAKPIGKDIDTLDAPEVPRPCPSSIDSGMFDDDVQEPIGHKPAWSLSGERFINNPRTEDLPNSRSERPQSPELDMTSAYSFQMSKMASENRISQQPRRVGIKDLLQESNFLNGFDEALPMPATSTQNPIAINPSIQVVCQESQARNNLKRSFEAAFSFESVLPQMNENMCNEGFHSNDDIFTESAKKQPAISITSEDVPSEAPVSKIIPSKTGTPAEPIAIAPQPDYFQPSKRRRFAQAAACVALGGAAAFTFMVSTAPVL